MLATHTFDTFRMITDIINVVSVEQNMHDCIYETKHRANNQNI